MGRFSFWVLLGLTLFAISCNDVLASGGDVGPSESECRPYIEKAINELKTGEPHEEEEDASGEAASRESSTNKESDQDDIDSKEKQHQGEKNDDENDDDDDDDDDDDKKSNENAEIGDADSKENAASAEQTPSGEDDDDDNDDDQKSDENDAKSKETDAADDEDSKQEDDKKSGEDQDDDNDEKSEEKSTEKVSASGENEDDDDEDDGVDSKENTKDSKEKAKSGENNNVDDDDDDEDNDDDDDKAAESGEDDSKKRVKKDIDGKSVSDEDGEDDAADDDDEESKEKTANQDDDDSKEKDAKTDDKDVDSKEEDTADSKAQVDDGDDDDKDGDSKETAKTDGKDGDDDDDDDENEKTKLASKEEDGEKSGEDDDNNDEKDDDDSEEETPEDELLWEGEIPDKLRSRSHITELLQLDEEFEAKEKAVDRVAEIILRDIKRIYENGIKPLETLYKYRDLSNRHFSDPEIFSKPLILFMGPWSGGKSSILNYLTGNEYTPTSLKTGAEPSPAYFNILMWGNETEKLDGTQLAADYTFSGLQKFGQGLEDRLRGLKLPSKLLEKVNIVEIPGILEVRKQVSRLFPFNDACQWFIDRADIIFLIYDPAKLDVGPETEAILDQLKGREYQTRIVLNKADTVKPEELLRVQSALIWNISPLMSSAQPPLMYTTSLWSHPYEHGSPVRLLQAQERAFLRDMREAIDRRIEHKISSARRFAVRVRNHVKMVDCYLNTYYNHKTLFGNRKRTADNIIDNPQNYHIYEGLSTLTNISRYDLPDPEVYRDFFRLNPLFEFKKLSETCTYFRGCPINKLDVAIAYDLPELTGKYKKMAEIALANVERMVQKQQIKS